MKKIILYGFVLIILNSIIGCAKKEELNNTEQFIFQGLILDINSEEPSSVLVVSQEDIGYGDEPTLIRFSVPEGKLYDEDNNQLKKEQLIQGNLLEITSDGVFLESYPLQLGTVYQVKVIGNGSDEEIEKYRVQFKEYL